MKKGDIVRGRKKSEAIHPIVYIKAHDKNFFVGMMLTTSENYRDNILMNETHFENTDDQGKPYKLQFNNTHLVNLYLLKKAEWAPFEKVGKLSKDGLRFIESNVELADPLLWEEYTQR